MITSGLFVGSVTLEFWLHIHTLQRSENDIFFNFVIGSVFFTPSTILWALPWHIDPLISSEKFELLEFNLSVGGRRLNALELASLKYSVNISDAYIIVEIPVGADGGFFQVGSSKFTPASMRLFWDWGIWGVNVQKASLKKLFLQPVGA